MVETKYLVLIAVCVVLLVVYYFYDEISRLKTSSRPIYKKTFELENKVLQLEGELSRQKAIFNKRLAPRSKTESNVYSITYDSDKFRKENVNRTHYSELNENETNRIRGSINPLEAGAVTQTFENEIAQPRTNEKDHISDNLSAMPSDNFNPLAGTESKKNNPNEDGETMSVNISKLISQGITQTVENSNQRIQSRNLISADQSIEDLNDSASQTGQSSGVPMNARSKSKKGSIDAGAGVPGQEMIIEEGDSCLEEDMLEKLSNSSGKTKNFISDTATELTPVKASKKKKYSKDVLDECDRTKLAKIASQIHDKSTVTYPKPAKSMTKIDYVKYILKHQ